MPSPCSVRTGSQRELWNHRQAVHPRKTRTKHMGKWEWSKEVHKFRAIRNSGFQGIWRHHLCICGSLSEKWTSQFWAFEYLVPFCGAVWGGLFGATFWRQHITGDGPGIKSLVTFPIFSVSYLWLEMWALKFLLQPICLPAPMPPHSTILLSLWNHNAKEFLPYISFLGHAIL